jgi:hypothetical protein
LPKKSPFVAEIVAEGDKTVSERKELELRRQHLLEERATLEQGLGNAAQIKSDMGRFSDIFGVLTPDKKRQALKLLIHRIVVNHMPEGVTKSTAKNGSHGPFRQKNSFSVNLELYVKSKFYNSLRKEAGFFVFHTEMAARAGIRDKILRVSMPFEKGRSSTRRSGRVLRQKRVLFGNLSDPWAVVIRVHSWAKQLREGRVQSCSEVAKIEGITRARVSQLWPLSRISKEQAEQSLRERSRREISLRALIRFARNTGVKLADSGGGDGLEGN